MGEGGKCSGRKKSEPSGQEGGTAEMKAVKGDGEKVVDMGKAGVSTMGLGRSMRRRHVGGGMVFPLPYVLICPSCNFTNCASVNLILFFLFVFLQNSEDLMNAGYSAANSNSIFANTSVSMQEKL